MERALSGDLRSRVLKASAEGMSARKTFLARSRPMVLISVMGASSEWLRTPPLWHIDAAGGVHPITGKPRPSPARCG